MIYIKYGPADEIDVHPSAALRAALLSKKAAATPPCIPSEIWRYRYIEGIGSNVEIEFVDTTMTGEFHMTMDPSEKDALLYVPGAGLTHVEQMGQCDKSQRFNRTDGTHLGTGRSQPVSAEMNEFTRLEQFAKLQAPPPVKFKDLEAAVNSTIKYNLLPHEGARRLHSGDRQFGAFQYHHSVRAQGSAVQAEGRRLLSHREHLRPDHFPGPAAGELV